MGSPPLCSWVSEPKRPRPLKTFEAPDVPRGTGTQDPPRRHGGSTLARPPDTGRFHVEHPSRPMGVLPGRVPAPIRCSTWNKRSTAPASLWTTTPTPPAPPHLVSGSATPTASMGTRSASEPIRARHTQAPANVENRWKTRQASALDALRWARYPSAARCSTPSDRRGIRTNHNRLWTLRLRSSLWVRSARRSVPAHRGWSSRG